MPTSLFQYEMLPTTWFYLSSLLILAAFFRFTRLFSVRNFDVLTLILFTPGLVYVAMGSKLQGYMWLGGVGICLFARLVFDLFLRRRPLLEPNLNYSGLMFSCIAACAFIIPNLFINRGNACESPRAWRLEQILAAEEESDGSFNIKYWPGYRPFLHATQKTNKFFAPSVESWDKVQKESRVQRKTRTISFFGVPIRFDEDAESKRPAKRAVQWASGVTRGAAFDFEDDGSGALSDDDPRECPDVLNGLQAAPIVPSAPIAPSADGSNTSGSEASDFETRGDYAADAFGCSNGLGTASKNDGAETKRGGVEEPGADETLKNASTPLTLKEAALILCVTALQIAMAATIVLIGRFHFGSLQTGLACGLLYLLLPYINQFSARLDHIAPALAILLAVLFYRRPVVSGIAIGVAGSLVFYPFFLIPLWLAFYWKKGAPRFALGLSAAILTFAAALLFVNNPDDGSFGQALSAMFGRHSLFLADTDVKAFGLWDYIPRFYRVPLIALFGAFCLGFALWTPQKNLATLISCSAALMLGVQFWMGRQGGLYMSWYLPLVVLTVFRPNLEDRTALNTVVDVYGAANANNV